MNKPENIDKAGQRPYNALHSSGETSAMLDLTLALRGPGVPVPFAHRETVLPQDILGETVTFDDPVLLEGMMVFEDDTIRLTAILTAVVHAQCANCLNAVATRFEVPVEEVLFSQEDPAQPEAAPREDDDRFFYKGAQADVSHLVLTNLLLALPIRFLCRKDCRGLLDEHGTIGDDSPDAPNNPFSVLEQLLTKDEEV
ncbi:MAG: hypothetical protein GX810_09475 [Clostridiales bacterium]|nr:hypothetical protein [Clostridiales bacterium]